jgi:manganese/iron transport system permease protein
MSALDVLTAPWEQPFMQRAFLVAVMAGIVCGVVGCHVVLRGMAFIGDAVAHAVFPGVAIAFALQLDLAIGGAIAGVLTALGIVAVSQNRRLKEDTVIGVFFAAAFALGIVVLSSAPGYGGSLESFLFGQILGISDDDVRTVAAAGAAVVLLVLVLHRRLVAVGLDRETARAAGLPIFLLDVALYAMVAIAIVISLQAVGNILVLALLVTPAACARLLTDRLGTMLLVAPTIGALCSLAGLYLSYHVGLAAGGLIVLVVTGLFVLSWLLAPRHGALGPWLGRRIRAGRRPPLPPR